MKRVRNLLLMSSVGIVVGCSAAPEVTSDAAASPPADVTVGSSGPEPSRPAGSVVVAQHIATTAGDPSGNRVVAGSADLGEQPVSASLGLTAEWVVGAATSEGVVWVAVDEGGSITAVVESQGVVQAHSIGLSGLPAGSPPMLLVADDNVVLFDPRSVRSDIAPFAGQMVAGELPVVIDLQGSVFIGTQLVEGLTALPDTRVVVSSAGLLALLTDPTDRLRHAVLGDVLEAETVSIVDPRTFEVIGVLDAPDDTVFEAISPLWADIDGDGNQEVVVTASDSASGARLTVFRPDGTLVAESAPIGLGNRWLNQLGVAPLGPDGEVEVVEVRTPHIGGVVQWYKLEGDRLVLTANVSGYSTHGLFSRNLDEGLIVDADGDGRLEVVVPTQDDRSLVALQRAGEGALVSVQADLPAPPSSNLAGVTRVDGSASLALGLADGRLLIWP